MVGGRRDALFDLGRFGFERPLAALSKTCNSLKFIKWLLLWLKFFSTALGNRRKSSVTSHVGHDDEVHGFETWPFSQDLQFYQSSKRETTCVHINGRV